MPVLPTRVDPRVTKGQVLAILEAMKMEHEVRVSDDGIVRAVPVEPGQQVNAGDVLVVVAAWITLNQPERRNARGADLVDGLRRHLATALADSEVRTVVLAGAGAAFCPGADLKSGGYFPSSESGGTRCT